MQINESHVFGPTKTNVFTAALSHYVAQFAQDLIQAYSTLPLSIITSGLGTAVDFSNINPMYNFPQGRNILNTSLLMTSRGITANTLSSSVETSAATM